jgi:hypothetical protein
MVHPALAQGYRIQSSHPMWFIFDYHTPSRQFKRGMKYSDVIDFPAYSKPPYEDLTETDEPPPGLMPFAVPSHK